MGNFVMPRFQYIINNDEQAQLYGDDGTGPVPYVTGLVSPTGGKASMIGELDWFEGKDLVLLDTNERIAIEASSDGVKQQLAATVIPGTLSASNPAKKGTVIRVVTQMPSLEETAYQNIPIEKRYQLSKDCDAVDLIVDDIVKQINGDKNSLVSAIDNTPAITIMDNDVMTRSDIFIGSTPDGEDAPFSFTKVINPNGAGPINTYEALKNIQWSNSVDFDRNAEYYPERGAKYRSYYFKRRASEIVKGGHTLPSQVSGEFEVEYIFYVKENIDFDTAMQVFAADVNVP